MESIYTFKFNEIQRTYLLRLFTLLSDKIGMEILGFDRKLIKIAGQHIVDSLLYIINGSLLHTTFPDEWKLARATPVFKNNGDVDVMSDYHHRSISVIGHKAKMVEQLVRSQLVRYLEEHYFITPGQSAYLKGHSTQTSLHRVIDKQRVLMHRHQGWNVRHGLCHIYMRYLYIYELFIAFVCFVVCSLL